MVATITEIDLTTRTVKSRTFTPRKWESYENVLAEGGSQTVIREVPNGWYNRPDFGVAERAHGTWGMHGTDLAWFPLPR